MTLDDTCTCFHPASEHASRTGRCRAEDSYGLPCACPSFEHDPNNDEHPDDDWDEFDPDEQNRGQP